MDPNSGSASPSSYTLEGEVLVLSSDPRGIEHMLAEVRELTGQPGLLEHVEQVAAEWTGAKERMAGMREYFAALADGAQ